MLQVLRTISGQSPFEVKVEAIPQHEKHEEKKHHRKLRIRYR